MVHDAYLPYGSHAATVTTKVRERERDAGEYVLKLQTYTPG
jgi:hypothetical protein